MHRKVETQRDRVEGSCRVCRCCRRAATPSEQGVPKTLQMPPPAPRYRRCWFGESICRSEYHAVLQHPSGPWEGSIPMKWQWCLLLSTSLAAPALAQESSPAPQSGPVFPTTETPACPPAAVPCPVEPPVIPPGLFPNGADTRGNRLSGNHNFVNFINWISDPLQNIDPRAVTAMYPIFGNEWVSTSPPIPSGDFQLYGPGMTSRPVGSVRDGLEPGWVCRAHFSRNPIQQPTADQVWTPSVGSGTWRRAPSVRAGSTSVASSSTRSSRTWSANSC